MGYYNVNIDKFLTQTITYWAPQGRDGFGKYTFSAPQTMNARHEEKLETIKQSDGEIEQSTIVIWTKNKLERGGYVYIGTTTATDPTTVSGAKEILQNIDIPSIDGNTVLHKVLA